MCLDHHFLVSGSQIAPEAGSCNDQRPVSIFEKAVSEGQDETITIKKPPISLFEIALVAAESYHRTGAEHHRAAEDEAYRLERFGDQAMRPEHHLNFARMYDEKAVRTQHWALDVATEDDIGPIRLSSPSGEEA